MNPTPSDTAAPPGQFFTLWHRPGRYFRWRPIAGAATEAELTGKLPTLPSGEYLTLRTGEHPKDRRKG
jgi:hypothetical protein